LCADTEDVHVADANAHSLASTNRHLVYGDILARWPLLINYLERSSILIGNTLFWMSYGGDVLAFDIERQSLGVIKKPADAHATDSYSYQLLRTDDDSGIGLAVIWKRSIQLYGRGNQTIMALSNECCCRKPFSWTGSFHGKYVAGTERRRLWCMMKTQM
jgi:hypothetical protein